MDPATKSDGRYLAACGLSQAALAYEMLLGLQAVLTHSTATAANPAHR
ncbi:MAG: hypothetical protein H6661_09085 [Ardenticatenaceae bacterium]|nr:hypothetical protein [Ardenticatenaceae bacterium]